MPQAALTPILSGLVAEAPETADMTLPQALQAMADRLGIVWDKRVLDGYPGERGFDRATRARIIVGASLACWALILLPFVLAAN